MMKKIFILLTIFTFTFYSCSSDNNENDEQNSEYVGNWSGTYSGSQDNGTWEIDIANDGTVTGTASSIVFSESYEITGSVDNSGSLTSTFGETSVGGVFNGQLNETTASGTWINSSVNMNGTWNGNKN